MGVRVRLLSIAGVPLLCQRQRSLVRLPLCRDGHRLIFGDPLLRQRQRSLVVLLLRLPLRRNDHRLIVRGVLGSGQPVRFSLVCGSSGGMLGFAFLLPVFVGNRCCGCALLLCSRSARGCLGRSLCWL